MQNRTQPKPKQLEKLRLLASKAGARLIAVVRKSRKMFLREMEVA